MILFIVNLVEWSNFVEPLHSFTGEAEALAWAKTYAQEHKDSRLTEVVRHDTHNPTEFERVDEFSYEPPLYTGPTVRAKLPTMSDEPITGDRLTFTAHRVPIDCATPYASRDLTVDWPYRILDTEPVPDGEFFRCRCLGWKLVEGSPESIAQLIDRYGGELIA